MGNGRSAANFYDHQYKPRRGTHFHRGAETQTKVERTGREVKSFELCLIRKGKEEKEGYVAGEYT
jgi:hypothetical protein